MPSTKKLKAAMALNGDNQIKLAQALHMSRASINGKVNGRTAFSVDEIGFIIRRYNLSPEDAIDIFFAD